jgi:DivIVA domain-containing protein
MPLTPEDVRSKRFTPVRLREGYDMGEVDQFLDEVEAELERLTQENNDLRAKLEAAQNGSAVAAPAAPQPAAEPTPEPAAEAPTTEAPAVAAPTPSTS